MIGFWSTLSLNIPDFTRYGKSQKAQTWGQALGLPTTMTLFAFLSVMVTSGSQAVYGTAIWDPVQLAAKTDNVAGILFALVTVLVATLSVNIAANLVSPAFDFSNIAPRKINFRMGALATCVLGVLIFPGSCTPTRRATSSPGSASSAVCSARLPAFSSPTTGSCAAPSSTSPTCTAPAAATGTTAAGTGGPSSPSSPAVSWPSAAPTSTR